MQRKQFAATELLENSFVFIKEQLKSIETWFMITFLSFLAIVGLCIAFSLFTILVSFLEFFLSLLFVFVPLTIITTFLIILLFFVFIKTLKKIISFGNIAMLNSLDLALHRPMRKFEQKDDRFGFIGLLLTLITLISFGFLFLIIPGIYFMVRTSMSYTIYLEEKCSPFQAIAKSFEMTEGNFWPLLMPVSINLLLFFIPIVNIINMFFIPVASWNSASVYAQLKNR